MASSFEITRCDRTRSSTLLAEERARFFFSIFFSLPSQIIMVSLRLSFSGRLTRDLSQPDRWPHARPYFLLAVSFLLILIRRLLAREGSNAAVPLSQGASP